MNQRTGKRHLTSNVEILKKAKDNLAAFLRVVDSIAGSDDSSYRNDSSDGVECISEMDLEEEQHRKIDELCSHIEFFPEEEKVQPICIPLNSDDINYQGKWGYTKLHIAVIAGDLSEIKALIDAGARTDITDTSEHTVWDKVERLYDSDSSIGIKICEIMAGLR